jgi:hypothetical protein
VISTADGQAYNQESAIATSRDGGSMSSKPEIWCQLAITALCMNRPFVVKKRRTQINRPMVVDLWSVDSKLARNRHVGESRLVFTDGVRWRLRLPLQPESRRNRELFRARPDLGSVISLRVARSPNCQNAVWIMRSVSHSTNRPKYILYYIFGPLAPRFSLS